MASNPERIFIDLGFLSDSDEDEDVQLQGQPTQSDKGKAKAQAQQREGEQELDVEFIEFSDEKDDDEVEAQLAGEVTSAATVDEEAEFERLDTRGKVLFVYERVWEEYKRWKESWNEAQLDGLRNLGIGPSSSYRSSEARRPLSPLSDSDSDHVSEWNTHPRHSANTTNTTTNEDPITLTSTTTKLLHFPGTQFHSITRTLHTPLPSLSLPPLPPDPTLHKDPTYESYQPTRVAVGIDVPKLRDYVPEFIPCADEEEMDERKYLRNFGDGVGWQPESVGGVEGKEGGGRMKRGDADGKAHLVLFILPS